MCCVLTEFDVPLIGTGAICVAIGDGIIAADVAVIGIVVSMAELPFSACKAVVWLLTGAFRTFFTTV